MKAWLSLALLPLPGCATTAADLSVAPGERVNTCNPAPGQNYLGQKASSDTARAILAATGATRLRWIPPRNVVTMEFAYGRVTVSYDDDYAIRQVTCG